MLAFSNLFGVATGDEPASVQHGVIAAKTRLDARRGAYDTPYHGPGLRARRHDQQSRRCRRSADEPARRAAGHARQGTAQLAKQHLAQLCHSGRPAHGIGRRDLAGKTARRGRKSPRASKAAVSIWPAWAGPGARRAGADAAVRRRGAARLAAAAAGLRADDLVVFVGDRLVQSLKAWPKNWRSSSPTPNSPGDPAQSGFDRRHCKAMPRRRRRGSNSRNEEQADYMRNRSLAFARARCGLVGSFAIWFWLARCVVCRDAGRARRGRRPLAELEEQAIQPPSSASRRRSCASKRSADWSASANCCSAPARRPAWSSRPTGYIVSSAFNFVQKPDSILVTLADGTRPPAKLVATDHSRMLVLLKVKSETALPVPEAVPANEMRVGQWAIAVGRTFEADKPNVSVGIVSALDRVWGRAIQTDAKISPNNYGGPLVDISGRVLGVLVPLSPDATSEVAGVEWYDSGIGFAVPLDHVLKVLPKWSTAKICTPAFWELTSRGTIPTLSRP